MQAPNPDLQDSGQAASSGQALGLAGTAGATCVACGYPLRGLSSEGVCPECGTPVRESLQGMLLQHASRDYLRSLRVGVTIVMVGVIASIFTGILAEVGGSVIGATGLTTRAGARSIAQATEAGLDLLTSIALFFGYVKLTEPDPRFVDGREPNGARKVVRVTAAIMIVTALVATAVAALAQLGVGTRGLAVGNAGAIANAVAAPAEIVGTLAWIVGAIAWVVQFFAMMQYVRWLASRVPDFRLATWSTRYMWLLPLLFTVGCVLLGLGPIVAFVLYWVHLYRLRRQLVCIERTGAPAHLAGALPETPYRQRPDPTYLVP